MAILGNKRNTIYEIERHWRQAYKHLDKFKRHPREEISPIIFFAGSYTAYFSSFT